jgi:hypothetical protein
MATVRDPTVRELQYADLLYRRPIFNLLGQRSLTENLKSLRAANMEVGDDRQMIE